MSKEYLGDGAYAEFDGHGINLTTEDGVSVQNRVYMESEVVVSFLRFSAKHLDVDKLIAVLESCKP